MYNNGYTHIQHPGWFNPTTGVISEVRPSSHRRGWSPSGKMFLVRWSCVYSPCTLAIHKIQTLFSLSFLLVVASFRNHSRALVELIPKKSTTPFNPWGALRSRRGRAQMADSTPRRAQKRPQGTPTGPTPHQPRKKTPVRYQEGTSGVPVRLLTFSAECPGMWSEEEIKALVEFAVLFQGTGEHWPVHPATTSGSGWVRRPHSRMYM